MCPTWQQVMSFERHTKITIKKNVSDLMNDDPGKAFATLRRLGAQPGDGLDDSSFDIVDHLEKNLTAEQSVEMIADHFSKISQEFPALCVKIVKFCRQKT